MAFTVCNRQKYLAMLQRELEEANRNNMGHKEPVELSDSDSEHETQPYQTFPTSSAQGDAVVKQDYDLTCGMRCLQNMYGVHIVTREEMDTKAKLLEQEEAKFAENVEPKYNPELGDYSIEVLKAVLEAKGKWTQRIAIDKLPSEYYLPVLELNPTFSGFIVALPGHYVTVRYANGAYKCIDSLKGVPTRSIDHRTLFKVRGDAIYCSQDADDMRNVIAVVAVAGSPFVEYTLLHDTWAPQPPSPHKYRNEIGRLLRWNLTHNTKRAAAFGPEAVQWYRQWSSSRIQPSTPVSQFLCALLRERVSDEKTVIVKNGDEQAAIRCMSVQGMVQELFNMQWISPSSHFYFELQNSIIQDEDGNDLDIEAEGSLEEFGLHDGSTITLKTDTAVGHTAHVGGFYTFESKIEGTCIGQQHNAYSVRDTQGKVHIVYKHCIQKITQ